ncbi:hypothetical protein DID77_04660, partial [Candidatus Marinamargulisbacteria bacterium SCGC AG-439-L15]
MKKYVHLILGILIIVLLTGCSFNFKKLLSKDLTLDDVIASKDRIVIKDVALSEFFSYPLKNSRWVSQRMGVNPKFYKVKVHENTFTYSELKQLMKLVYRNPRTMAQKKTRKVAIVALENSVYQSLLTDPSHPVYNTLKNVLYSEAFLKKVFPVSETMISMIPETLSTYNDLTLLSVKLNPKSFAWLPMSQKRREGIVRQLYNAYESETHVYQRVAIQYADRDLVKTMLSNNGALLEYLSPEYQNDLQLAYMAILQNDLALDHVSPEVRETILEIGIENLNTWSAKWALVQYSFLPTVTRILAPFINTWHMSIYHATRFYHKTIEAVIGKETKVKAPKLIPISKKITGKETLIYGNPLDFDEMSHVVIDSAVVAKVETIKSRRLLNLWRIASTGKINVYVAYFKPLGRKYLGSIIVQKGSNWLFSDYLAIYTYDGL